MDVDVAVSTLEKAAEETRELDSVDSQTAVDSNHSADWKREWATHGWGGVAS